MNSQGDTSSAKNTLVFTTDQPPFEQTKLPPDQDATLHPWVEDAVEIVDRNVDTRVLCRVMKRTAQAASNRLAVVEQRGEKKTVFSADRSQATGRLIHGKLLMRSGTLGQWEKIACALDALSSDDVDLSKLGRTDRSIANRLLNTCGQYANVIAACVGDPAVRLSAALDLRSMRVSDSNAFSALRANRCTPAELKQVRGRLGMDIAKAGINLESFLSELLGTDMCSRVLKHDTPASALRRLVLSSEKSRQRMLIVLEGLMLSHERALAGAITRQGFAELGDIMLPDQERTLADAIGCARMRKELLKITSIQSGGRGAVEATAAKEDEIAHRVFSEVMRFSYHSNQQSPSDASRVGSSPQLALERRALNCFTGPWVMAVMMMRCGISPDKLFYCRVNDDSRLNWYGTHGALLYLNTMKQAKMMDFGYRRMGEPLRMSSIVGESQRMVLQDLLCGKIERSVSVQIDEEYARTFDVPFDMQIMPINQGFCSGHMLHVGANLVIDGKYDEADLALAIGLSFNPRDPDLLYYRGLGKFHKKHVADAAKFFKQAIFEYPRHLLSYYSVGELCLATEKPEFSRKMFEIVARDEREIFGDESYKLRAERALSLTDGELLQAWKTGAWHTLDQKK